MGIKYEAVLATDEPGEVSLLAFMRNHNIVRRPGDRPKEFAYFADRREDLEELVDVYWHGKGEVRARADEEARKTAVRVLADYYVAKARNLALEDDLVRTVEFLLHDQEDLRDEVRDAAAKSLGVERWDDR